MVARWLTTLSDPFHTLSDPSASPCNPADHPVPSTDSPAPLAVPYSPIQAHTPPIAFTRRKQASGGLRSGRTDADSMPIPPLARKMIPPTPSEKKRSVQNFAHPFGGKHACAQRGSHHEMRPQKRERLAARGPGFAGSHGSSLSLLLSPVAV